MRSLIDYARTAREITSIPAFLAYANLFNPTYWTRQARARADSHPDEQVNRAFDLISRRLESNDFTSALNRLANHLGRDLAAFDRILAALDGAGHDESRYEKRRDLHILHAIRQGLIMKGTVLVAQLPPFSGRHDVTIADLLDLAFALQFGEIVALLDDIFPVVRPEVAMLAEISEPTSLDLSETSGYPDIHENIRNPIAEIDELIREIGVGISHYYGAYG